MRQLYYRYIDDIIAIFEYSEEAENLRSYLISEVEGYIGQNMISLTLHPLSLV